MIYKRELDAIARNLRYSRETRPTGGNDRERQAWDNGFREATEAIADALHVEMGLDRNGNRRFRRERFLEAAGVESRAGGPYADFVVEGPRSCGICGVEDGDPHNGEAHAAEARSSTIDR